MPRRAWADRKLYDPGSLPIKTKYGRDVARREKQDRTKNRFIFTAIDANSDQLISGTETTSVPFDTATGFPTSGANSKIITGFTIQRAVRLIWLILFAVKPCQITATVESTSFQILAMMQTTLPQTPRMIMLNLGCWVI